MNELSTNLASRWKRLGGAIIDLFVLSVCIIPILYFIGIWSQMLNGMAPTLNQKIIIYAVNFIIFLIINGYLLYKKGQTVGKLILKMKIVDKNGDIPNFTKLILFRYFIPALVFNLMIIGRFLVFLDAIFIFGKERRCIHDYLAGTRVINL